MTTLFDASPYGPETRRDERLQPPMVVEPFIEPWRHVRNSRGVLPYTHLISANLTLGGVITACGAKGSWMSMDGVTQMIRCPSCDLASQLS